MLQASTILMSFLVERLHPYFSCGQVSDKNLSISDIPGNYFWRNTSDCQLLGLFRLTVVYVDMLELTVAYVDMLELTVAYVDILQN